MEPHPLLLIRNRRQTYGGERTARDREKARRSYFKYVAKMQFCGALTFRVGWHGYIEHTRGHAPYSFGTPFRNGYPLWEASRSQVRDQWERQFDAHRERAIEYEANRWQREAEERKRQREGWQRGQLVGNRDVTRFFQAASVAGALKISTKRP